MRPVFRPGVHVLRRNAEEVQVGLVPETAVVLDRSEQTAATLADLRLPRPDDVALDPVGALLAREGLLVDRRSLPDTHPALPVAVVGFGHPVGAALPAELTALLGVDATTAPAVTVLVGVGEPRRALTDALLRQSQPHLVVRFVEGRAVLGPFVVPGTTACLRCVDATYADADPAWPVLLEQYVDLSARDRADGVSEPLDPLLARLVLAWAARDLTTYARGGRPSSWSATVDVSPTLAAITTRGWCKHPACGCGWS